VLPHPSPLPPSFGLPGDLRKHARWCSTCPTKAPNAIDVVSKKCECGLVKPSFGLPGERRRDARWCMKCPGKPSNAINVVSKKCECGRFQPSFGLPGDVARDMRWCVRCPNKAPNAVNLRSGKGVARCECRRGVPRFVVAGPITAESLEPEGQWCELCPTKPKDALSLDEWRTSRDVKLLQLQTLPRYDVPPPVKLADLCNVVAMEAAAMPHNAGAPAPVPSKEEAGAAAAAAAANPGSLTSYPPGNLEAQLQAASVSAMISWSLASLTQAASGALSGISAGLFGGGGAVQPAAAAPPPAAAPAAVVQAAAGAPPTGAPGAPLINAQLQAYHLASLMMMQQGVAGVAPTYDAYSSPPIAPMASRPADTGGERGMALQLKESKVEGAAK